MATILATLKYGVMPNVQSYESEIRAKVSEATGMDVATTSIVGGWSGFSPYVELTGVELREPQGLKSPTRTAGSVALSLPIVRASLSIPYLAVGQIRFRELAVFQPQLLLIRAADGIVYFAGRPLNQKTDEPSDGRLVEWLLAQPDIQIHQATLTWRDDTTTAPPLTFNNVGIHIDKTLGRHNVGFVATPPSALAKQLDLRARLRINKAQTLEDKADSQPHWQFEGAVYMAAQDANLGELRRHLNVPDNWQSGVGTVRAWLDVDSRSQSVTTNTAHWVSPVVAIAADVAIINARVQLADAVAPLAIAKLTGRLSYQRLDDGFRIASNKLEFRTQEGVSSLPADFSLSLQGAGNVEKSRGEMTANGIDLKVVTALIDYFPIGKDVRQLAAKYGLRGAVKDTRFAWTGDVQRPRTYQIKGTLVGFSSNLNESVPGVSGFSGSIDGTEKGGKYTIASNNITLAIPTFFRAPIRLDRIEGRGDWQLTQDGLDIVFDDIRAANADLSAELSGKYNKPLETAGQTLSAEKRRGALDISLKLSGVKAVRLPAYFPNAASQTREYLEAAIRDGVVESATLGIKGQIYDFPYHNGQGGTFTVRATLKDIDFRYAQGWPVANNINAELLIDNTAIRAKIGSAQFYGARVRKTELAIADSYSKPFALSISGEADARAEEVSRYLRESPLVDTVGAFTKVIALEGPGKLNINLTIPIGLTPGVAPTKDAPKFRLAGTYALNRGSAKLRFGTQITDINGAVSFTEASVKSSVISGIAFGSPMAVSITGGGEAGVVTDFSGRADIQQLGDVLPFQMPPQVTGVADFTGRVSPGQSGPDLTIESSLAGITSTLPVPLAKHTDEIRRMKFSMASIGTPDERTRLNLAGNGLTGRSAESPEHRIEARFQRKSDASGPATFQGLVSIGAPVADAPLADGLWLAGSLRNLDFDQWLLAADNFSPKPAPASGQTAAKSGGRDSLIAGFDLSIDRLVAYTRPFTEVNIRGRKTTDRANPTWALLVASKEVEGDFTWRSAAFNERGAVRARLKRFTLADDPVAVSNTPKATELAVAEQDLPALDIVADEFTFKDRWLGKLELKATPQAANWRIEQLVISNGHARTEMDGLWQRYGDPFAPPRAGPVKSLTTMSIKVDSNNLNALFAQFGYGDQIRGGRGGLEGRLSWPGHVYQFQTANLSGAFKVNAERGQFVKMDPGAAKLLGLMSLQSIPRRLTFDFRDLFSEGYAFDNIEGDLTITDGVMFAKKFDISGPAAEVRMSGDIALPTERVNLTMSVAPRLGTVAAVGAGVLVNPLVGLGVLLGGQAFKAPLERVLSVQYTVSGKWDNPDVERVGKTTASVEAKPAATTQAPSQAPTKDKPTTEDRNKKTTP
jgi:uncharacterized protein (TIGR02099 family)